MSLTWREQLSVGNNVIDSDHRHLIEIINQVEQGMKAKNPAELMAALNSLFQYSQVHFIREENIAKAAGYEQVPSLSQSHQALLTKLNQIKEEIAGMGQEWSSAAVDHFASFLRSWLIDHIIKEDLLMKPALQKYSPSFDPR
jgi:hemerythrin